MLSYEQVKERARKRQQQSAQQATGQDKGKTLSFEEVKDRARRRLAQNTQQNAASVEKWFSDIRDLGSRVQEYYSGDGYKTPESSFNAEIDKYIGQAGKMLSYIKSNQQAYGDYEGLIQMHTDTVSGLQNMKSDIEAANNYFARFESAEAYKEAAYYQEYGNLSYKEIKKKLDVMPKDAEAYEWLSAYAPTVMTEEDYGQEISSVETELTNLEAVLEEYRRVLKGVSTANPKDYDNTRLAELRKQYGSEKDIEAKIEEIKATKWEYENGKKYNTLPLNEDFAEVSTQIAGTPTRGWGIEAFGKWYGQGDEIYDYINDIDGTRQKIRESGDKNDGDAAIYHYSLMSKDEIAKYNYLYNTSGKDAANEYLAYLENDLHRRRQEEVAKNNAEFATKHPHLADIYSIGSNLASGIGLLDIAGQNAVKGIKEAVTGEYAGPINYNSAAMTPNTISTSIRSTRAQNIANKYGVIEINEEEHPFWSTILNGKSFGDVYQLGMSMADSAAIVALSPVLGSSGTVLLGGSAGTQGVLNAVNYGATDEEALAMGLASGIFEMLFEKYSLETLLSKGGKTFIGKALRQSLAEGSEEFFTSAANNVADILIMAEKSGYLKPYLDAGMTENEALQKALIDMGIDMGWDFVGGMFSGFIMGGVSTPIMNRVNTEAQYRNASAPIKQTISMADFASQQSPVWNNVDYNDTARKTSIMQETHDRMVADGAVVNVSSEIMESVDQAYPDLRDMKKKARTPILKTAMSKLKEDIRQFLNGFKNQQFEFEVNGKVLEAKLYNTGINEVLEKVTKQKASMLYSTEDIFRNAQYLYSTQDYAGDPNVYRWNYFYTPIQIGDETVGVRIAVRDVATPGESQIYNWGIKKDTSLDGEGRGAKDRISHGVSSDVSNNSIPQTMPGVNNETVLQSTGEVVNFEKFTKVENGKATVLANGKKVDAADVSLGDEGTDLVFHSVIGFDNMTASGANAIMQAYKKGGVSAGAFGQGAAVVYRWGYHGYSETELAKQKYAGKLTDVQRDVIYQAGREAAAENYAQKQKEVTEKKTTTAKSGKVYYGYDGQTMNADKMDGLKSQQKVGVDFAQRLAKSRGLTIYFFESYIDENGKRVYKNRDGEIVEAPNGFNDPKDGSIHIDLNAGGSGQGTVLFTIAHEMVHFIKDQSPKHFKKLADILMKGYNNWDLNVDELVKQQQLYAEKAGRTLSYDEAFEEMVADSMESILTDGKVLELMHDIEATDRKLADKIKAFFQDIMELIRQTIDAYRNVSPESTEGILTQQMEDLYGQLQQVFAEGVYESGENYRKSEKDTTQGNVKYQARPSVKNPDQLDPKTVTRQDVQDLLENVKAGKYAKNTYIPVRISTPGIVQERLFAENLPIAMPVIKVMQAFSPDNGKIKGKNVRGHSMTVGDMLYIIEHLDSPDYLFSQPDGRGVAVLRLGNSADNTAVIVEFGNNINAPYLNGYEAGQYNISVTAFNIDDGDIGLFMYQMEKGWRKVFDKQKEGDPAKKFQATRPFAIEQDSLSEIVNDDATDVNQKFSARYQRNQDVAEDFREQNEKLLRSVSDGTKFSMRKPVEKTKDLIAFHNITERLLWEALKQKGLVMPSLAVTNKGLNEFGEISLLFDKSVIDPETNKDNKLYGADAWTPMQTSLKMNAKFDTEKTVRTVNKMKNCIGNKYASELLKITPKQFEETILQADGNIYEAFAHDIGMQTAYAMEKGIIFKIPTNKNGTVDKEMLQKQLDKTLDTDDGWRQYRRWLNNISDTVITSYDQATNEDILRHMKAQPATAKSFKLSENGELIVPAKEYYSINELQKNKNRLSENADEAAKVVASEFLDFAKKIGNIQQVVDAINASFDSRYSVADIVRSFSNKGIKISSQVARELQSLYKKAVELPTQYFEAKPYGEIGLDKVNTAVVPSSASAELRQELEGLGINVLEYNGTKESRVETINSVESIKFSARYQRNQDASEALREQNEKLQGEVVYLKDLLKLQRSVTGGTKFTRSSVSAMAKTLMKNNNVKGNAEELAKMLNGLYEYIATEKGLTWEDLTEQAQPAVDWLQKHTIHKSQMSEYARGILKDLRTSRVYLDDVQQAEAAHAFGSFNEYRKRMMGSIVIASEDSISLDSQWHELAGLYPDVFDENTSSADQPMALLEAIDRLRRTDTSALEYEYNRELIAQDLLRQVYDGYWRVSTMYTVADVKQREINKLKYEHLKRMEKLREQNRDKVEQLKEKHRSDMKQIRERYREKLETQQKEISARYQESRKRATESRHKTEMRHKIQKVVKKLNNLLLKETKDKHIPENLKKAVAEALDAVNMDTVGAEERLAKYDALIADATDPDVIASLEETRERIANAGDRLSERMAKLKAAYDSIKSGAETESASIYDEVIAEKIQETLELVGDTALRDMNMQQLEAVYEMYTMVSKSISNANKAFKLARAEGIRELGTAVGNEIIAAGGSHPYSVKALEGVKRFDWNNQKPVYAFERMGSKTLSELYENVRAGEDTWARDVSDAKAFYQEQAEKYGYDQWDMKKQYTFASTTGNQFTLTLEQIMSLYAYAKREQAGEHLSKGGFVFDSAIEVVQKKHGIPVKYKVNTASAYNLSSEILVDIVGTLTEEQAGFVDAMQEYLSAVMGEKGNEVSMALYDVKLFKEKSYFPLRTAKQYIQQKNEAVGELRLKNSGFSKKTVPHANNPVILGNFTDVWAGHVNDMSMYHAFVLPLEDFNRVYNYSEAAGLENADTESVKARIQNAYGKQANDYIEQLLKDLNGGARQDPRETATKKLVSNFKKAAVMGSLSVVIQQPTALVRAMAVVDGRYFGIMPITHGLIRTVNAKKHRHLWSEVKQYAPVAVIKEMGHFDTNMGRSTQDFIKAKEYKGLETVKGILTDSGYRDEVISRPAALADEMAWVAIWEAVKKETADKHKDLQPGSEAFLQVVGKRFTEVITKTQVYDSVLSRSANMRAKSGMMDMLTSFMAEPTTSINMLQDALLKAKRGDKKGAARAIGAVYGSVILNAVLVSFVYAMRDDDEDETFLEKYLSRTTVEVLDGMNPLTYIPFMKDIWSIMQGFDVERADMSLIADLVDAMRKAVTVVSKDTSDMEEDELEEHRKQISESLWNIGDSIASLTGLPAKNIRRDINGVINLFQTLSEDSKGRKTTANSLVDALQAEAQAATPIVGWLPGENKKDRLYSAIISGDTDYVERIKNTYASESSYETAVRSIAKNRFAAGDLSADEALDMLTEYGGFDKDEAAEKVSYWNFQDSYTEYADWSQSAVTKYYDYAKPAGIDLKDYNTYLSRSEGLSKKDDLLKVIDGLKLTVKQKDALYYLNGWAESKLSEAPWH